MEDPPPGPHAAPLRDRGTAPCSLDAVPNVDSFRAQHRASRSLNCAPQGICAPCSTQARPPRAPEEAHAVLPRDPHACPQPGHPRCPHRDCMAWPWPWHGRLPRPPWCAGAGRAGPRGLTGRFPRLWPPIGVPAPLHGGSIYTVETGRCCKWGPAQGRGEALAAPSPATSAGLASLPTSRPGPMPYRTQTQTLTVPFPAHSCLYCPALTNLTQGTFC